jgi:tetratricopeptide (TPR) repeat protein
MTIRRAMIAAVLFGVLGAGMAEAQNASIRPSPLAPLRATPRSNEEQQAYFEAQNAATARDQLRELDDFQADYINSEYRHLVLFLEWRLRGELGHDADNIIDVALRAIEAQDYFLEQKLTFVDDPSQLPELPEVEFTLASREAAFYQSIVEGYLSEGDIDEVLEYGELALTSMADAREKFEAVGTPGTPEYDETVEGLRGGQMFVLNTILDHYLEEDDFEAVVDVGNRILEVAPDETFVLRTIMQGYEDEGDTEQVLEYGRRLLEASPDDLNTLMSVSRMLSEQDPEGDPATHWEETRGYAQRASDQLDVFLAGPDSAQLGDDQKNAFLTDVNMTFGFAALQVEEFEQAGAAFRKALEGTPDDANLYNLLATAAQGNRDLDGMLSALARAVYLEHPDPQLRASLTLIYESVNDSSDGLDDFIASEGEAIDD